MWILLVPQCSAVHLRMEVFQCTYLGPHSGRRQWPKLHLFYKTYFPKKLSKVYGRKNETQPCKTKRNPVHPGCFLKSNILSKIGILQIFFPLQSEAIAVPFDFAKWGTFQMNLDIINKQAMPKSVKNRCYIYMNLMWFISLCMFKIPCLCAASGL